MGHRPSAVCTGRCALNPRTGIPRRLHNLVRVPPEEREAMSDNKPMSVDTWRDIPGFLGAYEINREGVIRSKPRHISRGKMGVYFRKGRIMHATPARCGYLQTHLRLNGKPCHQLVHRMIALAFIQNPENKLHVAHNDGNPRNNKISNLRWATHAENMADMFIHKTHSSFKKKAIKCKP